MATEIGSLLIDMRADVARLAQDMAKAQNTVEGAMKNVQRSAAAAVTALGLIGVGVSVAGMANVVKGAVGAIAALDDMAAKAGTTVENMSALVDIAKIGGHEVSVMEGAMVRLTKALAGGDDEAKGAGKALAALGLNAEKLRSMDTAQALLEVALALDKYGSGGGKTAVVLDLLGKSGAAALPYLEDLAEVGRLNASVTTDQAAAAERLEKDINAVKLEGDKMTRAMVAGMLPTMSEIAKAMRLAAEDGGTLKALFVGFGGIADQFAKPWKAAFLGLGAGLNEMLATFEEGLAKITFGDVSERHIKAAIAYREAAREMNVQISKLGTPGATPSSGDEKPKLNHKGGAAGGTGGSKQSPLDRLLAAQNKRIAELNAGAGDEQMVSVDSVRRQADKKDADALEVLRQKYAAMADPLQQYRVQLDEINMLREKGVLSAELALEAEWAVNEAMDKAFDTMKNTGEAMKENSSFARDMGLSMTSAFENAVIGGKKASDVIRGLGQDIGRIIMRKSITEPFGNAVSSFMKNIDFGNLFKAEGGPVTGGQSYIVGERGPEWFTPATSGTITPNHQLAAGGTTNHFTVDMRGASVEAVARLEQLVISVNGSIERRALNVMGQARVRGV